MRVRHDQRSRGLGAALFGWAIEEARRRGCALVQLTTDTSRADAHRFYERLGFVEVGRMGKVGFKFGRWLGTIYLQKSLTPVKKKKALFGR